MENAPSKLLLIYTGGTIGMIKDYESNALRPFDFENIKERIPELQLVDCQLETISFEKPIDSSDMNPERWARIAEIIEEQYDEHDGFDNLDDVASPEELKAIVMGYSQLAGFTQEDVNR